MSTFAGRKTTDGNPSMGLSGRCRRSSPDVLKSRSKRHYKQTLDASEATRKMHTMQINENRRARRDLCERSWKYTKWKGFFLLQKEERFGRMHHLFHKNEVWKQELQMAVETGVGFQPNRKGRDPWTKAGRCRLENSKWH